VICAQSKVWYDKTNAMTGTSNRAGQQQEWKAAD
jgi:hypothetical protein